MCLDFDWQTVLSVLICSIPTARTRHASSLKVSFCSGGRGGGGGGEGRVGQRERERRGEGWGRRKRTPKTYFLGPVTIPSAWRADRLFWGFSFWGLPVLQPLLLLLQFLLSRSEYSHACFAHCQEFLSCSIFYPLGPFIPPPPQSSPYLSTACVLANTVSHVNPRNKIGHPARVHVVHWVPAFCQMRMKCKYGDVPVIPTVFDLIVIVSCDRSCGQAFCLWFNGLCFELV